MGLIEVKKDFSRRELLWFGPLFLLFLTIIGSILVFRLESFWPAVVLWIAGIILVAIYYLFPGIRTTVYRGWIFSVMPIGWIIAHVVLAGIYYLVITPIGLVMRLFGYDPMHRRINRSAESYWKRRPPEVKTERYFKQF